ncbi:MAG: hypothetical protein IJV07_02345 [Alphaproteobacteria bacterium]|nr:hypothetical protein [Alphaproteobacteria bacterium]
MLQVRKSYYPYVPGFGKRLKSCRVVDENGVENGLYRVWDWSGKEIETGTKRNGVLCGKQIIRHANGQVATVCTRDEGELEGAYAQYWPDGSHRTLGFFKQNKPVGDFLQWNCDGVLLSHYRYDEHGKMHGECVSYTYNEVERAIYSHGDAQTVTGSSGHVIKTIQVMEHGKLIQQCNLEYNAENQLIERDIFSADYVHSHHTTYYPGSQRMAQDYTCVNMKKEGIFIRYFESGRVAERVQMCQDKRVGCRTLYYDNESSTVFETCDYDKNGLPHGMCVQYDEQGTVISRIRYHHGKQMVQRHMAEIVFNKDADREVREQQAIVLKNMRGKGERAQALLLARQFHLEKTGISQRTALKLGQEKVRTA